MKKIVAATRNPGKRKELEDQLADLGIAVLDLGRFPGVPEVEETGSTFEENAVQKARAVAAYTGLPALADDSGLMVDALDGAPGIRSARFAGPDADDAMNNRKLLAELAGVPPAERTARFVCVLALAFPEGELITARGECEGLILEQARGQAGFGYDPLFYCPGLGATFSEVSREVKLSVSHRGRALRELKARLAGMLAEGKRG